MVLYQVNVEIEESIEQDWVEWMKSKHIPDVVATGCFLKSVMTKDMERNSTYCIIYYAEGKEVLDKYLKEYSNGLREEHNERYSNRFRATRKINESIAEFMP